MSNKIIRSICWFTSDPSLQTKVDLEKIEKILTKRGFIIQTKRICTTEVSVLDLNKVINEASVLYQHQKLKKSLVTF